MDFQAIADGMSAMTCVVSVERQPDGSFGPYRIVTGNKAYIDSIEHPAPGTKMLHEKFVPNSEYTDYITRDLNFEEYCYRAAFERKCLHSYAHPDRMEVWFNMMFLPVGDESEENIRYCLYIMEINMEADSSNLSNTSAETASSVLDTCIRLRGTSDFKATMQDIIRSIRELCGAEHCCILVMNELERTCYALGESFADGSPMLPMETYLDEEFYDIADSWTGTIAGSNCLIVKDEHDMEIVKERNPVWYESLMGAGVNNIVLFPLKSRNQLLGYMWAINYDKERSVKIKETLEVTTFILGSELGNYLLLDRLRLIGSKDMLTGVMNRNEMNNHVDELSHGISENTSVGVIFADLNGLKTVNDAEGHNAGDLLLKNAANVLRSVFDESEIFRAGGDEFSVIVTGVTDEGLEEMIAKVRKASERYDNVSFALGGAVEKNSVNVRMALRRADEKMYEDKRRFYEQFPDLAVDDRRRRANPNQAASVTTEDDKRKKTIFREMNYDFLTGLPSMTYFFKLAEMGRNEMHNNDIPSALLSVNFNGMRQYNKKHGMAEGDVLIKALGKLLAEQFGEECCSRFGQDHFAVFTEEKDLEKKIKKIFRLMKTANGGKTLPLRIGIYPDSMGLVESSLACDRAQYACDAIRDDNNSYFNFYNKDMLDRENNMQYVVDNLDRAIEEEWITAFYQPIVRATNGRVCDEEALCRWIDPKKGMLSPADFIPILEDTRLIYKVDLHMVDIILERLKNQLSEDFTCVPISVNLSRSDFECCDIVEEIDNRVRASGVPKDLLTIEITESIVGENFDYMKEQIERFQDLGFKVWMDDFGSGYSSLDLLQEMQFDCIKFDMRFMRQFDNNLKSRVILTELMRMAVSLNIETVTEGVETAEQVEFLREIGCNKMQGYHFCKPIPRDDIYERYRTGKSIGFENPDEAEYFRSIGLINLYDLGAVSTDEAEDVKQYFDTLPMAVIESDGKTFTISRCNKSYRDFVKKYEGYREDNAVSESLLNAIKQCEKVGQKVFINETTDKGNTVNAMIRRVADNPVKGVGAFAVAVLGMIPKADQPITYTVVARALSADYIDMYLVDLDTEEFTQYSPKGESTDISAERSGKEFFATSAKDALQYIYKDDQEQFLKAFTNENIRESLDKYGAFTHTYRLIDGDGTKYVNMKAVRVSEDDNRVIFSVNDVDGQMRQQETLERMKEETRTFSRISALMGDFIAIYTVDPDTNAYMEYSASNEYLDMGSSKFGMDFFADSIKEGTPRMHPDDAEMFKREFTKENVLATIDKKKVFHIKYRLNLTGDGYTRISLRVGRVMEKDGPQIIAGVSKSTD